MRNALPERWYTVTPPMGSDPAWPLPSESRRVRTLLYISEGVILGAGSLLLALGISGANLVALLTGSLALSPTALDVFTLFLVLFFAIRWVIIRRVSPPAGDKPSQLQDWSETRQWRWVFIVALPVSVVLFGSATLLWSWREMIFLRGFDLLLLGSVLAGSLLYVYILHKIGV